MWVVNFNLWKLSFDIQLDFWHQHLCALVRICKWRKLLNNPLSWANLGPYELVLEKKSPFNQTAKRGSVCTKALCAVCECMHVDLWAQAPACLHACIHRLKLSSALLGQTSCCDFISCVEGVQEWCHPPLTESQQLYTPTRTGIHTSWPLSPC